jgi:hypothetical protein
LPSSLGGPQHCSEWARTGRRIPSVYCEYSPVTVTASVDPVRLSILSIPLPIAGHCERPDGERRSERRRSSDAAWLGSHAHLCMYSTPLRAHHSLRSSASLFQQHSSAARVGTRHRLHLTRVQRRARHCVNVRLHRCAAKALVNHP